MIKSVAILSALVASAAASTLKFCDDKVCINGVREKGVDTYTIAPVTAIPEDKFGWLAMGFGVSMITSDIVMMWPNDDCTLTLSQRATKAYAPPALVAAPARPAKLDEDRSYSNETGTGFTFTIPSDQANEFPIIYAYAETNPDSADPAAPIRKHTWTGHAKLNFGPKKCKPKAAGKRRSRMAKRV